MTGRPTKWVSGTVAFLAAFWLVGCYIPTISNWWVRLGLLSPAGADHVFTFPAARPAVGMTVFTMASLFGALFLAFSGLHWLAYIRQDEFRPEPPRAARTPKPGPSTSPSIPTAPAPSGPAPAPQVPGAPPVPDPAPPPQSPPQP